MIIYIYIMYVCVCIIYIHYSIVVGTLVVSRDLSAPADRSHASAPKASKGIPVGRGVAFSKAFAKSCVDYRGFSR